MVNLVLIIVKYHPQQEYISGEKVEPKNEEEVYPLRRFRTEKFNRLATVAKQTGVYIRDRRTYRRYTNAKSIGGQDRTNQSL